MEISIFSKQKLGGGTKEAREIKSHIKMQKEEMEKLGVYKKEF